MDNNRTTVALYDRLYASMNMSTNSYPQDQHRLSVNTDGNELNLHFDGIFLSMSLADWQRVTEAVNSTVNA